MQNRKVHIKKKSKPYDVCSTYEVNNKKSFGRKRLVIHYKGYSTHRWPQNLRRRMLWKEKKIIIFYWHWSSPNSFLIVLKTPKFPSVLHSHQFSIDFRFFIWWHFWFVVKSQCMVTATKASGSWQYAHVCAPCEKKRRIKPKGMLLQRRWLQWWKICC